MIGNKAPGASPEKEGTAEADYRAQNGSQPFQDTFNNQEAH